MREGEARILTVPNLLSVFRLACVPLFLYLLFGADNAYGAALLLAALGCTDWIDGYVARRFNQVSELGKVLDPTADRILVGVGVVAILVHGSVPAWVGVAVLVREVLISLAVVALAALGARRIDVQWVGKAGTFALMVAFPLFLTADSTAGWRDVAEVLAWIWVIPGLVLSWYAAATYVPLAKRALDDRRVGSPT